MPSDLNFTQLINPEKDSKPLVILDSNYGAIIRVGTLVPTLTTGSLDIPGVVEFMYKLMERCNETQTKVNANAKAGARLTSFPAISYSAPKRDSSGELRTQSTQQLITKLTVHGDFIVGITS